MYVVKYSCAGLYCNRIFRICQRFPVFPAVNETRESHKNRRRQACGRPTERTLKSNGCDWYNIRNEGRNPNDHPIQVHSLQSTMQMNVMEYVRYIVATYVAIFGPKVGVRKYMYIIHRASWVMIQRVKFKSGHQTPGSYSNGHSCNFGRLHHQESFLYSKSTYLPCELRSEFVIFRKGIKAKFVSSLLFSLIFL